MTCGDQNQLVLGDLLLMAVTTRIERRLGELAKTLYYIMYIYIYILYTVIYVVYIYTYHISTHLDFSCFLK